jgi:hypothetical protein
MNRMLDILILTALPSSGKSEVLRYLGTVPPDVLRRDFHLGGTVHLDDAPYVYLMRRIDQFLEAAGRPRLFFPSAERAFRDPREWGTLIELLNEDFEFLETMDIPAPPSAAYYYLQRLDEARVRAGLDADLSKLNSRARAKVAAALEPEAAHFLAELRRAASTPLEGKTLVIEIARGGPEGSRMPLVPPHGYAAALSRFSKKIIRRAAVLYIWVTPEQSRRRNAERAASYDGAQLGPFVPNEVMRQDFGCDDIDWLLSISETPDRIRVTSKEGTFVVPLVRFDNRSDRTSFLLEDPSAWNEEKKANLHASLRSVFDRLGSLVDSKAGSSSQSS